MADPEIAKRNARRNYKTTANEEFDAADARKLDDSKAKNYARLTAEGKGLSDADPFRRMLNRETNRQLEGGKGNRYTTTKDKWTNDRFEYAKGGGVTRFKDDHCGHHDMKRGGPVKGKC
jgi:hypothetical protein